MKTVVLQYFGSKFRATKYYPEPKYGTIIEPFAGGAGYSPHESIWVCCGRKRKYLEVRSLNVEGEIKMSKSALIIVDLQRDFCEGGELAVPGANDEYLNRLDNFINQKLEISQETFQAEIDYGVYTFDFHPADHKYFANESQPAFSQDAAGNTYWPPHCIQYTDGANSVLSEDLRKCGQGNIAIYKGVNKDVDSYSAFIENDKVTHTGLHQQLQYLGVTDLTIIGLALDYCVRYTCEDAVALGYNVALVPELCRAIGDVDGTVKSLESIGVKILKLENEQD